MRQRPELNTKSERREIKKRPRMNLHGAALKRPSKYAGLASIARAKKKR